jgi:repressor LexA
MAYLTKIQKEVYEFLEEYIKKNDIAPSLREIGEHLGGYSAAVIQQHLIKLEEKGFIKREFHKKRAIELIKDRTLPKGVVEAPVLGYISDSERIETKSDLLFMRLPEKMLESQHVYVLTVKGNFIANEGIFDGDFVIIESRNFADNGDIALIILDAEKNIATLRKILKMNEQMILLAPNPNSKEIIVKEDQIKVQGIVRGLIRDYKKKV